ncbi:low molecular weight phosphotyrosine protein phosphatase [Arthrobacter sp. zg-Y20]|uniref:low molecular weight protein-tyrosine-phosphatase n=1 Tax=unclassified Arthrobacter TaxID=235627 RepID=UPI001D15C84F|nr:MULTISPECIES: low molecular weight protein-tyrosine-phosphatase [unclassified Arthrobacter]MCC3275145.1 low molecular weight phosphotyrosine protein phosphatase [Arthrobacter sp. zg-Y20]MDK1315302.1 low molecular weight protein-tyrosine-phosphatase [Arthrobacter sp. zg.Y20]WIB05728.1 low molecular weight protein-tyrosine-phosphatase [Arthrobacter sp. zg-Y20]
MFRIQTICTGNICRSPMAQFALARAFGDAAAERPVAGEEPAAVAVDSAGLSGWEAGKPMDKRAAAELRRHGYPDTGITAFRARGFQPEWFAERDLILAMDYGHFMELSLQAPTQADRAKVMMLRAFDPALQTPAGRPHPSAELGIADPWYGDQKDFEESYALITAAVPGVLEYVEQLLANRCESRHDR